MKKVISGLIKICLLFIGLNMLKSGVLNMNLNTLIIASLLVLFSTRNSVKKMKRTYRKSRRTYRKVKRNITSVGKVAGVISRFI